MRNPARKGKADSCHSSVGQAMKAIGLEPMDLSRAGDGVEDWLVPLRGNMLRLEGGVDVTFPNWWLLVECKTAYNKRGEATPSQYTKDQKEWRAKTEGWPRITVTSAQDAVDQIRELTK